MLNMPWPFHIFLLFLLFLAVASQDSAEILTLHDPESTAHNNPPHFLAVSVGSQDLNEVANSVFMAETWLRTHVLPYYPATHITHIVVGHNLLCLPLNKDTLPFPLILPALKNLYHSLTRWGLEREIKVSPSLSSHCLAPNLGKSLVLPLLDFIQSSNSSYLVNLVEPISDPLEPLQEHLKSLKKLGFLTNGKVKLVIKTPKETKPTMRKLSFYPYLGHPTLSPSSSPVQSFPIAKGPLPPLVGVEPTYSPPPHSGPSPSHSPHHHLLPPCNPWPAPPPVEEEKLWCVAKPSVPAETLQEAMDYACGEGGAECDEIQPNGNCFYPDTLVAHASFAFNSYWQKTKRDGGTCSFGGTAMIINSDPSFIHCKFIVS